MSKLTKLAKEAVELCDQSDALGKALRRWTPEQRVTRYRGHAFAAYLKDLDKIERLGAEIGRLLAERREAAAAMLPAPGYPITEALAPWMS